MGNGTTTSVAPSTVALDANGHRFEILMNDSTSAATFRIDGNPVCTSLTASYPAAGNLLETWTSVTTLTGSARHVEFSYLDAFQDPRR